MMPEQSVRPDPTWKDQVVPDAGQRDETLELEDAAWQLYVRGNTPREIAKALGRSLHWANLTIRRMLELRDNGRQQVVRAHVEKLLDEVSLIRQAAWSGWERSQTDKVRTVEKTKAVGPKGGGGDESTVTTEPQSGDAAFLRVLLECNKRESALRGIEKPIAVLFQFMQSSLDIDTLIEQLEAVSEQEQQPQLASETGRELEPPAVAPLGEERPS